MYEDIIDKEEHYMYEKCCSKCKYSEYDETHSDTIPSIHICYNKESEYYECPQAWSSTCDKFVSETKDIKEVEKIAKEVCGFIVNYMSKESILRQIIKINNNI